MLEVQRASEVIDPNAVVDANNSPDDPMISIRQLDKKFRTREGVVHAVKGVSFDVWRGEFVTLLGPSGCGKTTILRSVAGLEDPSGGDIEIDRTTVFSASRRIKLSPAQRKIGMVFQSYAIWPHMTVLQNVAYPLKMRRVPRSEIRTRTYAALRQLGLEKLANRSATNLSGGQQQRVAVARALVAEASVILFDEPLSNLDAKLRKEVRQEIRDIQQRLGITVLYVTHDQEEAMAVSDRIIVLREGVIRESGAPERIYSRPSDAYSARFMGDSNILTGSLLRADADDWLVRTSLGDVSVRRHPVPFEPSPADEVLLAVRPENVHLRTVGAGVDRNGKSTSVSGQIRTRTFLGPFTELLVTLPERDQEIVVRSSGVSDYHPGDPVAVSIPAGNFVMLGPDSADDAAG